MDILGHWDADKRALLIAVTTQGTPIMDGYYESPDGDRMVEYVPASELQGAVDEVARLRDAIRRLLAAHAEYRDTDSLLTATLDREFPELRGR